MRLIGACLLSGCWYGQTTPVRPTTTAVVELAPPTPEPEPSYRATTIVLDAVGVAAMTAGMFGLRRYGDNDLSGGLAVAGLAVAGFGTPITHLVHGHKARAGGSYLLRSIGVSMGMMIGYGVECSNNRNELFCGFEGMLWGSAGGLALAGVVDALILHGNDSTERRTWVPTVTAGDGAARIGIAGGF